MANELKEPGQLLFAQWNLDLDEVPLEQLDHYIAVENYLTDGEELPPDATNLDKVRGYLEAFNHLDKLEDWERASEILSIRLNTPTKEKLYNQLYTWGYYHQQIELYSRLIGKLNTNWDIICWRGMGSACLSLEEYPQAMKSYQQCLTIANLISDRDSEVKAKALVSLGITYFFLSDYPQAIKYLNDGLEIAKSIGDRDSEGSALANLGTAYLSCGNYLQALKYLQQSLTIARSIGYRYGLGSVLADLGVTLFELHQYSESLESWQIAREIFREIGSRSPEATVLYKLAESHQKIGNLVQALEYCSQALTIATELGIPLAKECQELKEHLIREKSNKFFGNEDG